MIEIKVGDAGEVEIHTKGSRNVLMAEFSLVLAVMVKALEAKR